VQVTQFAHRRRFHITQGLPESSPIEPFVQNTPEKAVFLWQSVALFKVYFKTDSRPARRESRQLRL
jgi:hypothetical protein